MADKDSLFDLIPGYREAVQKERAVRSVSFIEAPEVICGLKVRPLNMRHIALLEALGNPFMMGGAPTAEDIAAFMWIVSVQFKPFDIEARDAFIRSISFMDASQLENEIVQFMDEAWQDSPSGRDGGPAPTSWAAAIVDAIASEYGWSEQDIMDVPVKRLFQYMRRIRLRNDIKAVFIDPSDKLRAAWLESQNKTA